MRPEDLRDWLFQYPFQPFRMYLLEVIAYEIHHPEMVVVKRSTVDLYFAEAYPRAPLAERQVTVALLHISRLEAIAPAPSAGSIGA